MLKKIFFPEKKIGYALSGGAIRGFAHIGVLKELEKHGILPDYICGTSAGCIIGGLYAAGFSASELEKIAKKLTLFDLAAVSFNKKGMISSKALVSFLAKNLNNITFSELKIPFKAIATDIKTGSKVVFEEGNLVHAIKSSALFPVMFAPSSGKDKYIFDGGICNNLPVSDVKEMGADIVIAVDLIPPAGVEFEPQDMFSICDRSIDVLIKKSMEKQAKKAEILIEPITEAITSYDPSKTDLLIKLGEKAARKAIKKIKRYSNRL